MRTIVKNWKRLPAHRRFHAAAVSEQRQPQRTPRLGLALSGGGVKAVAHIGVLSALRDAGLNFDMVAGTSAGALVGLFYCAGHDPDSMSRVLQAELAGRWWWRWLPMGKYLRLTRLLRCGGLQEIMRRHVSATRFEDLQKPFFATSTDLVHGEAVIHERGDVVQAVQASMSLPGFANPVRDGDRLLVDGGLLTYLPSEILRQRGADIIVGVELAGEPGVADTPGCDALSVFGRVMHMQHNLLHQQQLAAADVLIRPRLAGFGCADFANMDTIFERGREAGKLAAERIRNLIQTKTSTPF
jgi:NTE family protein